MFTFLIISLVYIYLFITKCLHYHLICSALSSYEGKGEPIGSVLEATGDKWVGEGSITGVRCQAGTLQVSKMSHSGLEQKENQDPNGNAPCKEAACGG